MAEQNQSTGYAAVAAAVDWARKNPANELRQVMEDRKAQKEATLPANLRDEALHIYQLTQLGSLTAREEAAFKAGWNAALEEHDGPR